MASRSAKDGRLGASALVFPLLVVAFGVTRGASPCRIALRRTRAPAGASPCAGSWVCARPRRDTPCASCRGRRRAGATRRPRR